MGNGHDLIGNATQVPHFPYEALPSLLGDVLQERSETPKDDATGTVWGHFWGHEGTGMPPDTGGTVALELKELLRALSCQSGSAASAKAR